MKEKKDVKIRYSPEELAIIKERAEKLGKSINEYQKIISKKAKVKIEAIL